MNKNTINKGFEKDFPNIIWKIEVDAYNDLLCIEGRDLDTTLPSYWVMDFGGHCLLENLRMEERDWTMETIQKGFLVLKKVGENRPTKDGIKIIDISNPHREHVFYQYVLLDDYLDFLLVRHRALQSGGEKLLKISTGEIFDVDQDLIQLPDNRVKLPIQAPRAPKFLEEVDVEGEIWLSDICHLYIWAYHKKVENAYQMLISLSDLNQIIAEEVILDDMQRMIPQPYFQVGRQLFFLSNNKQKIVSYLV